MRIGFFVCVRNLRAYIINNNIECSGLFSRMRIKQKKIINAMIMSVAFWWQRFRSATEANKQRLCIEMTLWTWCLYHFHILIHRFEWNWIEMITLTFTQFYYYYYHIILLTILLFSVCWLKMASQSMFTLFHPLSISLSFITCFNHFWKFAVVRWRICFGHPLRKNFFRLHMWI